LGRQSLKMLQTKWSTTKKCALIIKMLLLHDMIVKQKRGTSSYVVPILHIFKNISNYNFMTRQNKTTIYLSYLWFFFIFNMFFFFDKFIFNMLTSDCRRKNQSTQFNHNPPPPVCRVSSCNFNYIFVV
jgi:hypothetical protein